MEKNSLRVLLFIIIFGNILGRRHYSLFARKFISVNLSDGFRELRIAYKRILVLETSAFLDTRDAMILRRVTDGRRLVQLVYQDGILKDCEYTEKGNMILRFLGDFTKAKEMLRISTSSNVFAAYLNTSLIKDSAVRLVTSKAQLRMFKDFIDFRTQAHACHKLYSAIKRKIRAEKFSKAKVLKDTFKHRPSVSNTKLKQSKMQMVSQSRSKRDLFSGWLIFPGTKWCGDGDVADSYDDLGYDEVTDKCCRAHDNCPHIIERFTYKYNLFNYNLHTMSLCHCDNKFRRCLRRSKSATAKLVGQIFFNIIGPQCFKFSKEQVCVKRTWWGTCWRYGNKKSAHPRDSKGF